MAATLNDRSATFRQVLSAREFRNLLAGHLVTMLGDQALRVALALLVYSDTHSPVLTAFGYALTFLPWVVAGPLLSGLADRLPRRSLLWIGMIARGVIVAVMAVPGLPLAVVLGLVFVGELLAPPINAAAFSVLPEMLDGDRYVVGSSLVQFVSQGSQIVGYGAGGALVAVIGSRGAFGVDAASFVVAAAFFRLALRHPYPPAVSEQRTSFWSDTKDGFRVALGRSEPRGLLLLAWWGAVILVVPEGLAAPYAARVAHGGATATGWLLAAGPIGMVLGVLVIGRLIRPSRRVRLLHPMAVAAAVPLLVFAFRPTLPGAIAVLIVAGALWSYQVPLQAAFVAQIPPAYRGRAFGVAAAGMEVLQGIGAVASGGLAELVGVSAAIATFGALGIVGMLVLVRHPLPAAAPTVT